MGTQRLTREYLRVPPLYKQALDRIGIVARPELCEILQCFIIGASAATGTQHHRKIGIFSLDPVQYLVESTHIIDIQMRLLIFQIHRIDIGYRTVAVPLKEGDAGIFSHQVIDHAKYMILYLRVTEVEYHLVTEVIFVTVGQVNHPVLMFLVKLAFRIHHFRLYPYTELDTFLMRLFHETSYSVRQFTGSFFPVAQTLMVTATGILVGKPAIIQQEHVYPQFGSLIHQTDQFVFIKIEIGRFPVIK